MLAINSMEAYSTSLAAARATLEPGGETEAGRVEQVVVLSEQEAVRAAD